VRQFGYYQELVSVLFLNFDICFVEQSCGGIKTILLEGLL